MTTSSHSDETMLIVQNLVGERDQEKARADEAEARVRELGKQIADAHHDLKMSLGETYTTVSSAALAATFRIGDLTGERDRARATAAYLETESARVKEVRENLVKRAALTDMAEKYEQGLFSGLLIAAAAVSEVLDGEGSVAAELARDVEAMQAEARRAAILDARQVVIARQQIDAENLTGREQHGPWCLFGEGCHAAEAQAAHNRTLRDLPTVDGSGQPSDKGNADELETLRRRDALNSTEICFQTERAEKAETQCRRLVTALAGAGVRDGVIELILNDGAGQPADGEG